MKKSGGTKGDLIWAFCRKQCILPEVPASQVLRVSILRPLLRTSTTAVVARVIAEEMKMSNGLNHVLESRVHRVVNEDQGRNKQ